MTAVMRLREQPLEMTSELDISVPCNPTSQLAAAMALPHLMHMLDSFLDGDTARRIESAILASSVVMDHGGFGCTDCPKVVSFLQQQHYRW